MNESIPLCVCPSQVRASPHVPGLLPSQAFGIRGCAPLCAAQQALGQSRVLCRSSQTLQRYHSYACCRTSKGKAKTSASAVPDLS